MSSSYLETALNPVKREDVIARLVAYIKGSGIEFDAIACRGVSGMAISPIISHILHKSLITVRKEDVTKNELDTHGAYNCEIPSNWDIKTYIIIDDFIGTGNTVDTIISMLKNPDDLHEELTCVGVFTYVQHGDYTYVLEKYADRFLVIMTHPQDIRELEEREEWNDKRKRGKKTYVDNSILEDILVNKT